MPETRSASRRQKRKRTVPSPISIDSDPDSDQSSVDPRTTPGSLHDARTKKKSRPGPEHTRPPTVNTTSAKGKARDEMPAATPQLEEGDWLELTDHILRELNERFGPSGGDLPGDTVTFLCEVLCAILLRLYREYSAEKLFGQGNSGPKDEVRDALKQDELEMSFKAVAAFADHHGCLPIETVSGNRATSTLTGKQFFEWIWGDRPDAKLSRKCWDAALFRQEYHRIRHELDIPGPAQEMRQRLEETLEYRFFQSQAVFSYPDPNNGTMGSTSKLSTGKISRRVWYHETRLPSEEVSMEQVGRVKRSNDDPKRHGKRWEPKRLPEFAQSWEDVISHCREHGLHFTTQ